MSDPRVSDIAYVTNGNSSAPVSSEGIAVPFENENFEGSVFFVHRPAAKDARALPHADLLQVFGSPWELQIQGRFKTKPQGQVFCGAELRDAPVQLGPITSTFSRLILKLIKAKAQQRGAEVRYALGNEGNHANAHMCGPLLKAYRIFRSENRISLPILHKEPQGTWHWQEREWLPIERDSSFFSTQHYFAFSFSTPYLDWAAWNVVGIPGLGSVDLHRFWGSQGCTAMIFDDGVEDSGRRYFFEMEMLPPCLRKLRAGSSQNAETPPSIGTSISTDVSSVSSPDVPSISDCTAESLWRSDEDEELQIPDEFIETLRRVVAPRIGCGSVRRDGS
jgi:hypothetical protein